MHVCAEPALQQRQPVVAQRIYSQGTSVSQTKLADKSTTLLFEPSQDSLLSHARSQASVDSLLPLV